MMNLPVFPSIPTDNLYKFVAISGLVLVVTSFIFPEVLVERAYKQQDELLLRLGQASVDSSRIESRLRLLESRDLEQTRETRDEITNVRELLLKHQHDGQVSFIQNEAMKRYVSQVKTWVRLSHLLMWLGFSMMIIGFSNWYFKVQRFQDSILAQAAKADLGNHQHPQFE